MRHSLHSLPLLAIALAVSIAAPGSARAQAAAPAFDAFLAGITQCSFTADFENFRRGVIERFANPAGTKAPTVNKAASVALPAALASAIEVDAARVRSDDGGESTTVEIPARGSFNGVPLKTLLFVLGNENGISLVGVEFAAPRDTVVKTFGGAIKRGSALLKKTAAEFEMSVGFGKPPAASIYCDQSN